MTRLYQLRTYTINKGQMELFVEVWRNQVVPLRQQFGFTVEGGWMYAEANKFVWMLSLDGTMEDWQAADQAYHASPERQTMNPRPTNFIAHMELDMLHSALE